MAEENLEKGEHSGLKISRVPIHTREAFIELAKEHFEDDYGMTLAFLMDSFHERSDVEILASKVLEHEDRINSIENKPVEKDNNSMRLLSGKKIIRGNRK